MNLELALMIIGSFVMLCILNALVFSPKADKRELEGLLVFCTTHGNERMKAVWLLDHPGGYFEVGNQRFNFLTDKGYDVAFNAAKVLGADVRQTVVMLGGA